MRKRLEERKEVEASEYLVGGGLELKSELIMS
jgi:hypothetical protein